MLAGHFEIHNMDFDEHKSMVAKPIPEMKTEKSLSQVMLDCGKEGVHKGKGLPAFTATTECIAEKFKSGEFGKVGDNPTAVQAIQNDIKCSYFVFTIGPEHTRVMTACRCEAPEFVYAGSGCESLAGKFNCHNCYPGKHGSIVALSEAMQAREKPQGEEDMEVVKAEAYGKQEEVAPSPASEGYGNPEEIATPAAPEEAAEGYGKPEEELTTPAAPEDMNMNSTKGGILKCL